MQVQWLWGALSEKGGMRARRDMTTQWVHNTTPTIKVLTSILLIVYTYLVDLCHILTLFTCSFAPPPPPLHLKTIWRWIYDAIHASFHTSTITLFSATNTSAVTLATAAMAHLPLSLLESIYMALTQHIPLPHCCLWLTHLLCHCCWFSSGPPPALSMWLWQTHYCHHHWHDSHHSPVLLWQSCPASIIISMINTHTAQGLHGCWGN